MVAAGSLLALLSVVAQAGAFRAGWVTPLAFFVPGTFITMAQGLSLPYGQAAAMAEVPRFAGTAAGIGVFMQNFCAAIGTQLYGLLADGTPRPMIVLATLMGFLTFVFGVIPYLQKRFGIIPPLG